LPAVTKDRSSLPATVTQRTDIDVTYALNEYTTDPILIPNADTMELSYNKRESVLNEHEAALRQVTADSILIDWAPTLNIARTTGDAVATHLTSTTGNRKKFGVSDLKNAMLLLNRQNIPVEERYALLSADMYQQLTDSMDATQYRDYSQAFDAKDGVLGRLYGFNIMMRSNVLSYTNDSTPIVNVYGASAAVTDNDAVLCWQKNAVERALGEVKFFDRVGDPTYYGDVYSVLVRMGARKRRNDEKGIVAIVQAASA
jgi:hypothetical protein